MSVLQTYKFRAREGETQTGTEQDVQLNQKSDITQEKGDMSVLGIAVNSKFWKMYQTWPLHEHLPLMHKEMS